MERRLLLCGNGNIVLSSVRDVGMHIKDKIKFGRDELIENGPITIVAFGDSVTHGAYLDESDYESVYWNLLKKKILKVRNYVPVNVINAGIGGMTASSSISRMDSQVIAHSPDLVIVCFGLNDINDPLEKFLSSLRTILKKSKESGADVIYMSPNMLNTYLADGTPKEYIEYAAFTAEFQNSGKMDKYIYSAIDVARDTGVSVCDCYSQWKKLSGTQDTTLLLDNRINHPIKEMHELFAQNLFNVIFDKDTETYTEAQDLMYKVSS